MNEWRKEREGNEQARKVNRSNWCGGVQGVVKAGLVRVKEDHGSRARELAEEELALQEGLDGTRHALSERAEENAVLSAQARPRPPFKAYIMLLLNIQNAMRLRSTRPACPLPTSTTAKRSMIRAAA